MMQCNSVFLIFIKRVTRTKNMIHIFLIENLKFYNYSYIIFYRTGDILRILGEKPVFFERSLTFNPLGGAEDIFLKIFKKYSDH
jgi:hypothetical protein